MPEKDIENMEFEPTLTAEQIDINILKAKIESLNTRIQFLEKNWLSWTKQTQETGQKLMIALTERVAK